MLRIERSFDLYLVEIKGRDATFTTLTDRVAPGDKVKAVASAVASWDVKYMRTSFDSPVFPAREELTRVGGEIIIQPFNDGSDYYWDITVEARPLAEALPGALDSDGRMTSECILVEAKRVDVSLPVYLDYSTGMDRWFTSPLNEPLKEKKE
jgi:hypothetical protein